MLSRLRLPTPRTDPGTRSTPRSSSRPRQHRRARRSVPTLLLTVRRPRRWGRWLVSVHAAVRKWLRSCRPLFSQTEDPSPFRYHYVSTRPSDPCPVRGCPSSSSGDAARKTLRRVDQLICLTEPSGTARWPVFVNGEGCGWQGSTPSAWTPTRVSTAVRVFNHPGGLDAGAWRVPDAPGRWGREPRSLRVAVLRAIHLCCEHAMGGTHDPPPCRGGRSCVAFSCGGNA